MRTELELTTPVEHEHAKSTAVTHAFTLACALFKMRSHILLVSDTEAQAINFLGDIKRELLDNEDLIQVFGVKRLIRDREAEIICEFHTGEQFRIIAKGSEQKLRGLKWRNKRPDMVVCDDLENDDIVMNEERRDKFRRWFYNALLPCGSKDCIYRVVGTILHMDSLLNRLISTPEDKSLKVQVIEKGLRQYLTGDIIWQCVRYKAHNEDFSLILWPEQFSEERLRRIRQDYINQGFPEGYSQEYLNYPIDESNAYFRKQDFLGIHDKEEHIEYYAAGDLAISERDGRAYTVFVVAGLNSRNRLKVCDVVRFRGDALDIIDTIFTVHIRYKPEIFFLEQENIARTLGPILNKEMEERGMYPRIEPMTASQDKIKRARALQARMRAGMVEFDREAEWFPTLQEEMLQFPRGAYMDQVDALAWIALGLDKLFEAPTKKEFEERLIEEEFEAFDEFDYFGGMSGITGY